MRDGPTMLALPEAACGAGSSGSSLKRADLRALAVHTRHAAEGGAYVPPCPINVQHGGGVRLSYSVGTVAIVLRIRDAIWYGSPCELGRRSSRYPR